MTHEQFSVWLQGYLEVSGNKEIKKEQVGVIRAQLDGVIYPPITVTPTNNFFNSTQALDIQFVVGTC